MSVRTLEGEIQEILRRDDEGVADDDMEVGDLGIEESAAERPATPAKRRPGRPATRRPSQVVAVENQLRRALGVKVVVHANGRGAGRIVIPFADLDEFQRLLDQLSE
jgi:hypothetical protein